MDGEAFTPERMFRLDDQVVIVSGAAGILGRVYALGLARAGANLVLTDIDGTALQELAQSIREKTGRTCLDLVADVSSSEQVKFIVDSATGKFGRIDVLVNNAVTKGESLEALFASTESYEIDTWRKLTAVNLDGVFLMAQAVGRSMQATGGGSIINISSIYGSVGPDQRIYEGSEYLGRPINTPAVYSTVKAGIIGLTRHLAAQWAPHGIRVNTLTPGGVRSGQNATFVAHYSSRTPLARMAEPHEMLGGVIFLASRASSYVTGHNLIIDGGWTAW